MESHISRPGHLTAHQVAKQLGISLGGVRLLVHRDQLKRSGGTPRQPWYAVDDVAALLAKRAARTAA
jgi:prophage antirepressor-like protein